jgi:hypothetical protein
LKEQIVVEEKQILAIREEKQQVSLS